MGTHSDDPVARERRETVTLADSGGPLLFARPGVVGNALCHGLPGFGSGELESGRSLFGRQVHQGIWQRKQAAHRAIGAIRDHRFEKLSGQRPAPLRPGVAERSGIHVARRQATDAGDALGHRQEIRRPGRAAPGRQPTHAAAQFRHAPD